MTWHRLLIALVITVSSGGCIGLQLPLPDGGHDIDDGGLPSDGDDQNLDGEDDGGVPVVTLRVSNPAPQVNEEVLLTCVMVDGKTDGVTFDFQPDPGRLIVDHRRGTAALIVEAADIGSFFEFTCTATNEIGTSQPSNEQLIIPTS